MKKNISINISGIIFHIEEDGYDKLKSYLESINKYFATFEDSKEIIEDIENRIAELFLSKLTDGNQVVAKSDVDTLITTMGSISDFEAAEEIEDFGPKTTEESIPTPETPDTSKTSKTSGQEQQTENESSSDHEKSENKKLYRDMERKLIGGVASGIAHHFNIDPLWVRLIIVIFAFNLVFWEPFGGIIIAAYIIAWIVLPASTTLPEDKNLKKMFRSSEERVLGGVASGLGAYFGVETTLIRILFIITSLVGGAGLILYIVLWIITPLAVSITDRIQMKGDPVTLSNIESSVKKSLHVEKEEEESTLIKILLFPFRLIATLFGGLGKAIGPLMLFFVEIFRVLAGIVILFTSVALILGITISLSVVLGLIAGGDYFHISQDVPYELIKASIPPGVILLVFAALLIPAVGLAATGASILAKRKLMNATTGWSMFGFWVLCIFALGTIIPGIVRDYQSSGEYRETQTFDLGGKTAILELNEVGLDDYDVTTLRIRGQKDSVYRLVKVFESRGRSRRDAEDNAKMISYQVVQEDSTITFDSNIRFDNASKFRAQELFMTLYVPYDQKFVMDTQLRHILRNTLYLNGYSSYDLNENTWMYTSEDGLKCLTCADRNDSSYRDDNENESDWINYNFENFSEINVGDQFTLDVTQSDEYEIRVNGNTADLSHVDINKSGDRIYIDLDESFQDNYENLKVEISMPTLTRLDQRGNASSEVNGFEDDAMELNFAGNATADINVYTDEIVLSLSDNSNITLTGEGESLEIETKNGAQLFAYEYKASNVEVESSDGSMVNTYATNRITINAHDGSRVRYKSPDEIVTKIVQYDGSRVTKQ